MSQLSDEFTIEVDGVPVALMVKRPNQEELFAIDLEYKRCYALAVRQDVMTEAEAKTAFENNGTWTKEHDNEIDMKSIEIARLEIALKAAKTDEQKLEIVNELSPIRVRVLELIGERTQIFSNTAEGFASDQRIHKMAEMCCVEAKGGDPYFGPHNLYIDFVSAHPDELSTIFTQTYLFEYKLNRDYTEEWGEMKYVKELNEKEKTKPAKASKKKASKKTTTRKKKTTRKTAAKKT